MIVLAVGDCFDGLRFGKISYQRFDLFHSTIANVAIGRSIVTVSKEPLGVGSLDVCLGGNTGTNIVLLKRRDTRMFKLA